MSTSYLNLLVRSTFWRLQLKSVQTSAVVCTDYTCSLHRLRRGFEFRKCKLIFMCAKYRMSKLNSRIYTHRDCDQESHTSFCQGFPHQNKPIIDWWWKCGWALQGRHSCIAQGASPGLIVNQHILSPKGAALLCSRQMLTPKVPLLRSSDLFYLYVPMVSYRALPSLHPGLCRGVVPKGTRKVEV